MPAYRVFRLKDNLRQQFRWAPHVSGVTTAKPKDYDEAFTIEADSPYAMWNLTKDTDQKLMIGDILSTGDADLCILKYIGFEEARWFVPEQKPNALPVDIPTEAAAELR